ncbi:MAG: hypothetical protein AAGA27_06635 [Pseudomonadota bacterium]
MHTVKTEKDKTTSLQDGASSEDQLTAGFNYGQQPIIDWNKWLHIDTQTHRASLSVPLGNVRGRNLSFPLSVRYSDGGSTVMADVSPWDDMLVPYITVSYRQSTPTPFSQELTIYITLHIGANNYQATCANNLNNNNAESEKCNFRSLPNKGLYSGMSLTGLQYLPPAVTAALPGDVDSTWDDAIYGSVFYHAFELSFTNGQVYYFDLPRTSNGKLLMPTLEKNMQASPLVSTLYRNPGDWMPGYSNSVSVSPLVAIQSRTVDTRSVTSENANSAYNASASEYLVFNYNNGLLVASSDDLDNDKIVIAKGVDASNGQQWLSGFSLIPMLSGIQKVEMNAPTITSEGVVSQTVQSRKTLLTITNEVRANSQDATPLTALNSYPTSDNSTLATGNGLFLLKVPSTITENDETNLAYISRQLDFVGTERLTTVESQLNYSPVYKQQIPVANIYGRSEQTLAPQIGLLGSYYQVDSVTFADGSNESTNTEQITFTSQLNYGKQGPQPGQEDQFYYPDYFGKTNVPQSQRTQFEDNILTLNKITLPNGLTVKLYNKPVHIIAGSQYNTSGTSQTSGVGLVTAHPSPSQDACGVPDSGSYSPSKCADISGNQVVKIVLEDSDGNAITKKVYQPIDIKSEDTWKKDYYGNITYTDANSTEAVQVFSGNSPLDMIDKYYNKSNRVYVYDTVSQDTNAGTMTTNDYWLLGLLDNTTYQSADGTTLTTTYSYPNTVDYSDNTISQIHHSNDSMWSNYSYPTGWANQSQFYNLPLITKTTLTNTQTPDVQDYSDSTISPVGTLTKTSYSGYSPYGNLTVQRDADGSVTYTGYSHEMTNVNDPMTPYTESAQRHFATITLHVPAPSSSTSDNENNTTGMDTAAGIPGINALMESVSNDQANQSQQWIQGTVILPRSVIIEKAGGTPTFADENLLGRIIHFAFACNNGSSSGDVDCAAFRQLPFQSTSGMLTNINPNQDDFIMKVQQALYAVFANDSPAEFQKISDAQLSQIRLLSQQDMFYDSYARVSKTINHVFPLNTEISSASQATSLPVSKTTDITYRCYYNADNQLTGGSSHCPTDENGLYPFTVLKQSAGKLNDNILLSSSKVRYELTFTADQAYDNSNNAFDHWQADSRWPISLQVFRASDSKLLAEFSADVVNNYSNIKNGNVTFTMAELYGNGDALGLKQYHVNVNTKTITETVKHIGQDANTQDIFTFSCSTNPTLSYSNNNNLMAINYVCHGESNLVAHVAQQLDAFGNVTQSTITDYSSDNNLTTPAWSRVIENMTYNYAAGGLLTESDVYRSSDTMGDNEVLLSKSYPLYDANQAQIGVETVMQGTQANDGTSFTGNDSVTLNLTNHLLNRDYQITFIGNHNDGDNDTLHAASFNITQRELIPTATAGVYLPTSRVIASGTYRVGANDGDANQQSDLLTLDSSAISALRDPSPATAATRQASLNNLINLLDSFIVVKHFDSKTDAQLMGRISGLDISTAAQERNISLVNEAVTQYDAYNNPVLTIMDNGQKEYAKATVYDPVTGWILKTSNALPFNLSTYADPTTGATGFATSATGTDIQTALYSHNALGQVTRVIKHQDDANAPMNESTGTATLGAEYSGHSVVYTADGSITSVYRCGGATLLSPDANCQTIERFAKPVWDAYGDLIQYNNAPARTVHRLYNADGTLAASWISGTEISNGTSKTVSSRAICASYYTDGMLKSLSYSANAPATGKQPDCATIDPTSTLTYTYAADGSISSLRYPDGKSVSYSENTAGALATRTDVTGDQTVMSYKNRDGVLSKITQTNANNQTRGSVLIDTYDWTDQPQKISETDASGTSPVTNTMARHWNTETAHEMTISEFLGTKTIPIAQTTYNNLGYVLQRQLAGNTIDNNLSTDATGHLDNKQNTYGYDIDGNSTVTPTNTSTQSYNLSDDEISSSDGSNSMSYYTQQDARFGDVASTSTGTITDNLRDQMVTFTDASGNTTSYTYYPDGSLHTKHEDSTTFTYYYDRSGKLLNVMSNNGTISHYIMGPAGVISGRYLTDSNDKVITNTFGNPISFYVRGLDGSVIGSEKTLTADPSQAIDYSPYGQIRNTNQASANGMSLSNNPLKYKGGYFDATSGLYLAPSSGQTYDTTSRTNMQPVRSDDNAPMTTGSLSGTSDAPLVGGAYPDSGNDPNDPNAKLGIEIGGSSFGGVAVFILLAERPINAINESWIESSLETMEEVVDEVWANSWQGGTEGLRKGVNTGEIDLKPAAENADKLSFEPVKDYDQESTEFMLDDLYNTLSNNNAPKEILDDFPDSSIETFSKVKGKILKWINSTDSKGNEVVDNEVAKNVLNDYNTAAKHANRLSKKQQLDEWTKEDQYPNDIAPDEIDEDGQIIEEEPKSGPNNVGGPMNEVEDNLKDLNPEDNPGIGDAADQVLKDTEQGVKKTWDETEAEFEPASDGGGE